MTKYKLEVVHNNLGPATYYADLDATEEDINDLLSVIAAVFKSNGNGYFTFGLKVFNPAHFSMVSIEEVE